ncbi:SIR2 family protein [Nocardiopsis sp. MT53]|uniref:SIR2 family protein n=1 Tax=Nocardiopsis sp. MT53 TaxID=2865672 RepID=UPI001C72E1BE|nr:SIR2 family protein [Nocardiopsis sp. MT53]QYX34567.1 SIR2 family protein [Nocardiopsis sp. MT53]
MRRFTDVGEGGVEDSLSQFRDFVGSFEDLLGPLDVAASGISAASPLIGVIGENFFDEEVLQGVVKSEGYLRDIYNIGVAITLDEIQRRAVNFECTRELAEKVHALAKKNGEKCYFGTLNYDGLVYASNIETSWIDKCDLAHGRREVEGVVVEGARPACGWLLREVGDFPEDRDFIFLELHGSIAWLKCPGCSKVVRFPASELRDIDYWIGLCNRLSLWQPQVILTSKYEKLNRMRVDPFSLAYNEFIRGVARSNSLLVAGYGFGDIGINEIIADALRFETQVLISTIESGPSDWDIFQSLGVGEGGLRRYLDICRCGLPGALSCEHWDRWRDAVVSWR